MNRRAARSVDVETFAQAQSANAPSAAVPAVDRKSGSSSRSPPTNATSCCSERPCRLRTRVRTPGPDHHVAPRLARDLGRGRGVDRASRRAREGLGQQPEQRVGRGILGQDAGARTTEPPGQRVGDRRERRHHPDERSPPVAGPQTRQAEDRQVGVELGVVAVHARGHDHAHVARIGVDRPELGRVLREVELLELDRRGGGVLQRRRLEREADRLQRGQRMLVGVGNAQVTHERDLDHRRGRRRSGRRIVGCRRLARGEQRRGRESDRPSERASARPLPRCGLRTSIYVAPTGRSATDTQRLRARRRASTARASEGRRLASPPG